MLVQRQKVVRHTGGKAMYVRAALVVGLWAVLRDSALLYRRCECRVAHLQLRVPYLVACARCSHPAPLFRLSCSAIPHRVCVTDTVTCPTNTNDPVMPLHRNSSGSGSGNGSGNGGSSM